MYHLFLTLLLLSILGFVIGLIKPSLLKIQSRGKSSLIFGTAFIIFFFSFGATAPQASVAPIVSQQKNTVLATNSVSSQPQAPLTDQQKVENAVRSAIQQSPLMSFKSSEIDGAKVTININAGQTGTTEEFVTETEELDQLDSNIFNQIFPINKDFNDIAIDYSIKSFNDSGKSVVIPVDLDMQRPTFAEIQSIQNIINSAIQQSGMPLSYKFAEIDTASDNNSNIDPSWPKGSKAVQIYLTTNQIGDATDFVTGAGKSASNIYRQVFPIDKNFYHIYLELDTNAIDDYGNTNDNRDVMDFMMQRPLYQEINWQNFSQTQNDIHFCAFLKKQNGISSLGESNQNYIYSSCSFGGGASSDLISAENSIEAQYPQDY